MKKFECYLFHLNGVDGANVYADVCENKPEVCIAKLWFISF